MRIFNRRDRRIQAQIDAMAGELTAFGDLDDLRPFIDRETASLIAKRDRLGEEMEDRHRQIDALEESIAALRAEIQERFRVAGALERALMFLADGERLPAVAE